MASRRAKYHSLVSASSSNSDGSLYPDHDDPLSDSIQTTGSLWTQQMLIRKYSRVSSKKKTLCCDSDKTRPWLLKLTFLFTVAAGLFVCGLALYFSTYSTKKDMLSGGDQVLLPISTHFNKKLDISIYEHSSDLKLKVHLLARKPAVSAEIISYSNGGSFYITSWTYQYWGLHLLKGTTLKISICADLHLQFYIIKSANKLKLWKQTTLFNDYDYHRSIHPRQSCDNASKYTSNLVTVHESDVYYLLFSSSVGWRFLTKVTVLLHFNRTRYDLSGSKVTCLTYNTSCIVDLSYGSTDIALVEVFSMTTDHPSPFNTVGIKYVPIVRWSFYFKLFGSIYVGIVGITIFYTFWRCCIKSFTVSSDERKPLLQADLLKQYTYSLQSAAGRMKRNKNAWIVVSELPGKEGRFEIGERDSASIMSRHRESLLSDLSVSSRESVFMRSRNESRMTNDLMYVASNYDDTQQLLDMTSAGVSAI